MLEKTKIEVINGFEIKSYVTETLTESEHQPLIRKWIEENLIPNLIKRTNKNHTSYRLKHMCENDLGFYVSNYDIKYHMAMLGIKGINLDSSINYCYPISEKWFKDRNKKRSCQKQVPGEMIIIDKNTYYDLTNGIGYKVIKSY